MWQAQKEHIVNPESAGANLAKDLRSLNLSERSKSPDNSPSRRQPNSEYQGFHFITSNNHCLVPGRCRRRSRSRLELGYHINITFFHMLIHIDTLIYTHCSTIVVHALLITIVGYRSARCNH
uniref:Uncharacterized protein n=1 Tax=Solanum tuberosum TaxID=4113 RepID=M1CJN0_SOLTU